MATETKKLDCYDRGKAEKQVYNSLVRYNKNVI